MVSARLEAQKQTIRHYWLNAIKLAKEIQKKTSIPLYSIERNLKKLRETGDVNHQCNNEDTYDISISHMSIWRNMKKK
ncbi:19104_t:CDS:2, partial [Funneliformis geosporum]